MIRNFLAIALFTCVFQIGGDAQPRRKGLFSAKRAPVIDMHIHASPVSEFGGGGLPVCTGDQKVMLPAIDPKIPFDPKDLITCDRPLLGPKTDQALLTETLAELRRNNVKRAVALGDLGLVAKWTGAGNGMYIPALDFSGRETTAATYRQLYKEGKFKMFGELGPQYRGFAPSDPVYAEYFALAEELDIPVGIHLGEGPPGGIHLIGPPTYRVKLGSPLLLEDLIVKHPKLRIYVMHYGSPLIDEMIAMMFSHPNLYVDVSSFRVTTGHSPESSFTANCSG
jgi:uncharacterized protein